MLPLVSGDCHSGDALTWTNAVAIRTPVPKCLHAKKTLGGTFNHLTFLAITGNPAPASTQSVSGPTRSSSLVFLIAYQRLKIPKPRLRQVSQVVRLGDVRQVCDLQRPATCRPTSYSLVPPFLPPHCGLGSFIPSILIKNGSFLF